MKHVTFTQEQIKAIQEELSSCLACAQLNGEFNADAFYGAVECSFDILNRDGYLYLHDDISQEA